MKLTCDNVNTIFEDCLFRDKEDTSKAIIAHGIVSNFGYHPERIEKHKEDIYSMLKQLPDSFQEKNGGGMSFLNACMDNKGNQWGKHRDMEQLFCLGIAAELCTCLLPKKMWSALPGGMPYYAVKERAPSMAQK